MRSVGSQVSATEEFPYPPILQAFHVREGPFGAGTVEPGLRQIRQDTAYQRSCWIIVQDRSGNFGDGRIQPDLCPRHSARRTSTSQEAVDLLSGVDGHGTYVHTDVLTRSDPLRLRLVRPDPGCNCPCRLADPLMGARPDRASSLSRADPLPCRLERRRAGPESVPWSAGETSEFAGLPTSVIATPNNLLRRFASLRIWTRDGIRAPHKPLLALWAISRCLRGRPRMSPFRVG